MKGISKNKRGISLIVLVITIIVMIILASAIILSLNGSGVIGRANEAKTSSDEANIKEAASVAYAEYVLDINEGTIAVDTSAEEYVKEKLKEQGISEETLKLVRITNAGKIIIYKMPVIPEGFTASDIETEDDVLEGLVIYEGTEKVSTDEDAQTTRNQYVWVPVPDISEFIRRDGYSNNTLQTFVSSEFVTEPYSYNTLITETNDLTGEYAEYAKMKVSVQKYGGFYIARYEAGTSVQRTNISNETSADILSQKDKYPYGYVGWGPSMTVAGGDITYSSKNQGKGAVELSRSIYPESSNKDIVSTLCYGVQWDAVINFMKDIENPNVEGKKYIEDSTNMGWYSNNYSTGNANHKTGIDVDDNASNMVKNIYDMAGNLAEWTMESRYNDFRVVRGDTYGTSGSGSPASYRAWYLPDRASGYCGFRFTLYIK